MCYGVIPDFSHCEYALIHPKNPSLRNYAPGRYLAGSRKFIWNGKAWRDEASFPVGFDIADWFTKQMVTRHDVVVS